MKKNKVDVISVCLSAFLFYQPEKVPAIFNNINADHQRMFDAIKESGLKWIAVLPPHIAGNLLLLLLRSLSFVLPGYMSWRSRGNFLLVFLLLLAFFLEYIHKY